MENDRLGDVLEASEKGLALQPTAGRRLVTLISFATLSMDSYARIRKFQATMKLELGLTFVVVGGGFGCTKVVVKIVEFESDDPEEVDAIVSKLLHGDTIQREAREVPFDVLVTQEPYERRDLRTGKLDGFQSVTVNIFNKGAVSMVDKSGDTYIGNTGITGPNAKVTNFTQVWNDWSSRESSVSLQQLAAELATLRQSLKDLARTPEEDAEVGAVAAAEIAAKKGDGSKMLAALAGAGKWALETARQIGVKVAAIAIGKALGL
jgi:hypothetical protein